MTIRRFYDRWPQYDRRLVETVAPLSDEQLALRPGPDRWPIWATLAHLAEMRLYWLCDILDEPGAERTPWAGLPEDGWEDDLDHPRSAAELVEGLTTTFAIVDHVLDTWTVERLDEQVERRRGDVLQRHTRGSIIQRMFTHDAFHIGEVSQTLGANGIDAADIWLADDPLHS